METTLGKAAEGEIVCEYHAAAASRLIAGLVLGFPASFFLYYLVTGLVEYARVATAGEWLSGFPGFLVVLALFLLFAVPAWVVVAGRTWVIIDFERGQIFAVRDFRVYRRTRIVPIDLVRDVWVAPGTVRTRGRPRSQIYEVQIILANAGKPITVGYEATGEAAGALARRLASRLRDRLPEPPTSRPGDGNG